MKKEKEKKPESKVGKTLEFLASMHKSQKKSVKKRKKEKY